jgi:hypothetical protein
LSAPSSDDTASLLRLASDGFGPAWLRSCGYRSVQRGRSRSRWNIFKQKRAKPLRHCRMRENGIAEFLIGNIAPNKFGGKFSSAITSPLRVADVRRYPDKPSRA